MSDASTFRAARGAGGIQNGRRIRRRHSARFEQRFDRCGFASKLARHTGRQRRCLYLAEDRQPLRLVGCADQQARFGVSDELLDLGVRVGGVERMKNDADLKTSVRKKKSLFALLQLEGEPVARAQPAIDKRSRHLGDGAAKLTCVASAARIEFVSLAQRVAPVIERVQETARTSTALERWRTLLSERAKPLLIIVARIGASRGVAGLFILRRIAASERAGRRFRGPKR